MKYFKTLIAISGAVLLTACGGDDSQSSSSDSPSVPNQELAKATQLSDSALSTVKLMILSDNAPAIPFGFPSPSTINKTYSMPTEVTTQDFYGVCGGSASAAITTTRPDTGGALGSGYPLDIALDGVFLDYCFSVGNFSLIVNGQYDATYHYDSEGTGFYTLDYMLAYTSNFPYIAEEGEFDFSEECTLTAGQLACTKTSSHEAEEGTSYTLYDVNLAGNPIEGYHFTGMLSDGSNENYSVNAQNIQVCDNGNMGTGLVEINENDDLILSASFSSCNDVTVIYNGVSYNFQQ